MINKEIFCFDQKNIFDLPNGSYFYGYVFDDEAGLCHYKKNYPNVYSLFENKDDSSGVYAAIIKTDDELLIFTDPLSQYSMFYATVEGGFVISNDIFSFKKNAFKLNESAFYDSVSYFSPLKNETLVENVYTLPVFSYIKVSMCEDGAPRFEIIKYKSSKYSHLNYDELLLLAKNRITSRAMTILNSAIPVVHLTGGLDSRLALAAIYSVSDTDFFKVTCLGNNDSSDKMIFNYLCDKYGFVKGNQILNGGKIRDLKSAVSTARQFNGLKHTSHSNYKKSWFPDRMEVTGYFAEGLLKDFGSYFKNGMFKPFDYAKKNSVFSDMVFDSTSFRMYESLNSPDNKAYDFQTKLNLMYINNRSKAHFGAQSVVNNRSFSSVDILYDPILLDLYRQCKYDDKHKQEGAVIIDLMILLVGKGLSFEPLAGKKISNYMGFDFDDSVPSIFNLTDLNLLDFGNKSSETLTVDTVDAVDAVDAVDLSDDKVIHSQFLNDFPLLKVHSSSCKDKLLKRNSIEEEAISSLYGFYYLWNIYN